MFLSRRFTVYVKNKDISFEVKSGKKLFAALEENGIKISNLCNGNGQCGKCKVKIESKNITKPTRLEKRSLSEMSLNMGIRLACEYTIKSDIVVDTEEPSRRANEDPSIVSVRIMDDAEIKKEEKNSTPEQHEDENEFKSVLNGGMFSGVETYEDTYANPEAEYDNLVHEEEEEEEHQEPFQETLPEEEEPIIIKYEDVEDDELELALQEEAPTDDYSTDGILLIQTPGGITYFHYSAGIGCISSRDFIETDKTLTELLRQGEIKSFLNANLRSGEYERAILILSEKSFEGESVFGLINYSAFNNDGLFCEVIQPEGSPKDILKFFRFLNQSSGRKLIIPLDSLEKVYFFNNGTIMGMDAEFKSDFLLDYINTADKNPVTKIADDFMSYEKKNPDLPPDALSLSALFKTAALLYQKGLLSKQYKLADKMSLVGDGLEGGHHIRLIAKFSGNSFKIDAGHDIIIPQQTFNDLFALRNFIHTCIKYAEKRCGKPDTLIFYSLFPIKELAESMIALDMIPKRYHEVIRTFSEDPTLFAINFFNDSTVLSYIESSFKMGEDVSLEDEVFAGIFEKVNEEFSSIE